MYGKNDLRASLVKDAAPGGMRTPFKKASYGRFYDLPPVDSDANGDAWYWRGQNLIVNRIEAKAGGTFSRRGQVDEYAILLPEEGMKVTVRAGGDEVTAEGKSVIFVPPGDSEVIAETNGSFLRLITTQSEDMVAKCPNAAEYDEPDLNVAPFRAWPEPVGGYRLRVYSGDIPPEPGRFGRLFRGSTIMVNFGSGMSGKRDPRNVSPHHHDDFEQYSIALNGEYVHHIRYPWTSDSTTWLDDEHEHCASPSVAVIPPPATHTSAGMTEGLNRLCDAFCPPRRDFSEREGWVLNADEYPMPEYNDE